MKTFRTLAAATALAFVSFAASAQDYGAMIQQALQRQNAAVQGAQQRVAGAVQQRMQDPQVQAAYQQYAWRMQSGGQRPVDFPTFTYQYIYTNGFSNDGIRHMQQTEAGIQQRESAAVQRLRQAELQRGDAQRQWAEGYSRNKQEAGRGLMGQSSYVMPNGASAALPHTWQANSTQQYNGDLYHVDGSGQYYVQAGNGWWYPVQQAR